MPREVDNPETLYSRSDEEIGSDSEDEAILEAELQKTKQHNERLQNYKAELFKEKSLRAQAILRREELRQQEGLGAELMREIM